MEQTDIHKLNHKWCFWYSPRGFKPTQNMNYCESLLKIGDVNSIEEFFNYYCFLKKPSDAPIDHKLMLFREGCIPMWENWMEGGCWIMQFKKKEMDDLNKKWELLLLACIGEQFDEPSVIGCVLSLRKKNSLLEIWFSNRSEEIKVKIGEKLRFIFNANKPEELTFYFKEHQKSLRDKSTLKGMEGYTFIETPMETPNLGPQFINDQLQKQLNQKLNDLKI